MNKNATRDTSTGGEHSPHPFDSLSASQRKQIDAFERELLHFNRTHNLISRHAEDEVRERHIRHSLTLAQRAFLAGATVVDWGTGGGLPAIPLAIAFPETDFVAVDSVQKKIQCVRAIARRLGLDNLSAWQGRAEEWPGSASYSVSRATAPLATLWRWHRRVADAESLAVEEGTWPPGLLALKGGDLSDEIAALRREAPDARVEQHPLGIPGPFEAKCIVSIHVPSSSP